MHYDYVVMLKRESSRKTDAVSFLLICFSILFFSTIQIRQGFRYWPCLVIAVLIAGLLISLNGFRKKKEIRFRYWLLLAGTGWLSMPFLQWMVIPYILFFFLEVQAKSPLEIGFWSEGLHIHSLITRKIPWNALQSVMLKDDLLTLDFRNNTLIQKEVIEDDEPEASEDEFNDYCRSKIVNLP